MKTKPDHYYIGIDLGDRSHEICVLDHAGEIKAQRKVVNDRPSLKELVELYPGSTVIMECGAHSPWASRYLESLGAKVLVANPRKVRAIYQNERKSDVRDAEMLARIGRLDPKLLHPTRHGSEESQQDLLSIKMRDSLVRSRVDIINAIRFTLKSLGFRIRNTDTRRFHKSVVEELPSQCHWLIPCSRHSQ